MHLGNNQNCQALYDYFLSMLLSLDYKTSCNQYLRNRKGFLKFFLRLEHVFTFIWNEKEASTHLFHSEPLHLAQEGRWHGAGGGAGEPMLGKVIPLSFRKPLANGKPARFPLGLQLSTSKVTSPSSPGRGPKVRPYPSLEMCKGLRSLFWVQGDFRRKGFSGRDTGVAPEHTPVPKHPDWQRTSAAAR